MNEHGTMGMLMAGTIPEIQWVHGDDLCNCTFQRIGEWTNPYLARTLRVRMCCIWADLYRQYPEFVQEIPAYYDENRDLFETESMEWNVEDADMPVHLWHRQIATLTGLSLPEVRDKFAGVPPPDAVPEGTGIKILDKRA
jgi:hypothetical protein